MKFRFERSRRVYNRVSKTRAKHSRIFLFFYFFYFFSFHFLSPLTISLPDLFFPFPFFLRRSHLRPDPPPFVVLPARRPLGASHLAWRSPDRREGGSQIAQPKHAPAQAPGAPAAQATPTGPQQATDLPCQHEPAFAGAPTCRNPHLVVRPPATLATTSAEAT